jgi:succinate dehydrogenase / fumarate reductase cytochrome b subunit
MAHENRPLSPHLGIYRWQWSNTLSIVHRATGVMLSAGALVLTFWLTSLAAGPGSYDRLLSWLQTPTGMVALFGLTFCFFYHLCNGLRHLFWDAGYGFEIPHARASGYAVLVASVTLTLLFWVIGLAGGGA